MIWKLFNLLRAPRASRPSYLPRIELLEDRVVPSTLPAGFTESLVVAGLTSPTAMQQAPDGRLFVTEQAGRVRIVRDGVLLPTPFVTIANVNEDDERGLMGIALDPDFAINRYVYTFCTVNVPGDTLYENRVSRFTANGDVVVPGSEVLLFRLDAGAYHNAGTLRFGTDRKLYVSVGDGAGLGSQFLDNTYGKILRFNSDGSIPTDNPFYSQTTGINRSIWALGLRNPFKIAIQPGTGRLMINEVGGDDWEEVNEGIAGSNYGWSFSQGPRRPTDPPITVGTYRDPLHAYPHYGPSGFVGCAITAGVFYNPTVAQFPADYIGDYLFADYCAGWIRRLDLTTRTVSDVVTDAGDGIVELQVSPDGSLLVLIRANADHPGQIWRIQHSAAPAAPTIHQHPVGLTVPSSNPATFSVIAGGTQPLSYQWQRNGVNIPGATAASYTISSTTMADNGASFRVVVANSLGSATSNLAMLTVTVNQPPVATITSPTVGALYRAGDTITFTGTGFDPETGSLPASAFTWQVDWYTGGVQRPAVPPTSGITGGSYMIPTQVPYLDTDVFYRIQLTVRDAAGLTRTVSRDVLPRTAMITTTSNVSGLQVTLDGQPRTSPYSVLGVVGLTRTLGVLSPQIVGGVTYEFESWSDGGAALHTISTPGVNTTYTANFRVRPPTAPPTINVQPAHRIASLGGSATFEVVATGSAPLAYQWQRNGVNIVGANASSYLHAPVIADDEGALFRVIVTNSLGSATSNAATLTIAADNPPTATITSPVVGTLYRAGATIHYSGIGTDPDEGTLPPSAHTWQVDFHVGDQGRIFLLPTTGATSGSFTIPTIGEPAADVFFRIYLTVRSANGITQTAFRDIRPEVATFTLQTNILGLQLTLDEQTVAAPFSTQGVVGQIRTIGVVPQQTVNGVTYEFVSWSDGRAASHTIVTPPDTSTFTATFRALGGDSLVGRSSTTGEWLIANSTGTRFSSQVWGNWNPAITWVDVQTGYFTNDGQEDLVGRDLATGQLWVGRAEGAGFTNVLWGTTLAGSNLVEVRVGDFNNDGLDDLVSRNARNGQWIMTRSTGTGFVTQAWGVWAPSARWNSFRVGDYNGDSRDDVAARNSKGIWFVALSTGTSFITQRWTSWSTKITWDDIQVGDFNGDGRDDLTGRSRQTGYWNVALSTGRAFANRNWVNWPRTIVWTTTRVGDFNNDGRDDLVGRSSVDGNWLVALSTGTTFANQFWGAWSLVNNWRDVTVGDYNNDRRDDLAGRDLVTGLWVVALSTNNSFNTQTWGDWSAALNWVDVQATRRR